MTHIAIAVDGSVGTITIDRLGRFNSLDVDTARDLRKAGLQLARDASVRAVVLRGTGGVFCSGADLKYIRRGGDEGDFHYMQLDTARGEHGYGEDDGFDESVQKIARDVAAGPTEAFAIAKELLNQSAGMDRLDLHLDRELENLARIADGRDFAEGLEAFFEKRPARFGGA